MGVLHSYQSSFNSYFEDPVLQDGISKSIEIVRNAPMIYFIGNGGSSAICSHMAEDYTKCGGIPSHAFSDPALVTCFANDYGYENAQQKWLEHYMREGDVLVAISSSGESANILNAANYAKAKGNPVITLSGFKAANSLSRIGDVNMHVEKENYGIVECFHQVLLHIILDSLEENQ